MVKSLLTMLETWVQSLGWEDPLEKETATHSSVLTWEIPGMEEPGGLQSMGCRVTQHHFYCILPVKTNSKPTQIQERELRLYFCFVLFCFPCWITESESGVTQSCPTLCNPTNCSLTGSSIHGIFQARILEWLAVSFSRRSSQPRD